MNERLKELVEKATTIEVISGRGYDTTQYITRFDKEKFSELIVKECIEEIKHLRMKYDTHRDVEPEENDRYIDAFLQAEVRLKELFGVKE